MATTFNMLLKTPPQLKSPHIPKHGLLHSYSDSSNGKLY